MKAKEKTLTKVPDLEETDEVIIKRLNFAEQSALMKYAFKSEAITPGQSNVKLNPDWMSYRMMLLVFGVKKIVSKDEVLSSWPIVNKFSELSDDKIQKRIDIIGELDPDTTSHLLSELEQMNKQLSDATKKE